MALKWKRQKNGAYTAAIKGVTCVIRPIGKRGGDFGWLAFGPYEMRPAPRSSYFFWTLKDAKNFCEEFNR